MKRRSKIAGLVAVGLGAYLIFLVVTLPAGLVWHWFGGRVPVQAFGVEGTLWSGSAEAVVHGPRRLDALRWDWRPASVLSAGLGTAVSAGLPDGQLKADVTVHPGERVTLRDARGAMDVDTLLHWIDRGSLRRVAAGRIDALFRSLTLDEGRIVSADGIINWNGARVGFDTGIALGDLALRLEPATDAGVTGELVSSGGVLDLSGNLRLEPNGDFELEGRIRSRDPDDPSGRRAAAMLGLANPDGTTRLDFSGNLDGSGLQLRQSGQ